MTWHEGDVIRKLRASVGWTLIDLATASGVNVQAIHKIERGLTREPKRTTLDRIGAPFGLSWLQILRAVPPTTDLVIKVRVRRRAATTRPAKKRGVPDPIAARAATGTDRR